MSAFRKPEIAKLFTEWLDRYAPPLHLRDKPQAAQAEIDALIGVLLRMAPQTDYAPFIRAVTEKLDFTMKVRTWPSVQELGAACSNARKEMPRPIELSGDAVDMSPEAINSRRMMSGQPVGEGWLYGRLACDLIAKGIVTREVMERYREGAYRARAELYDVETADRWLAEATERHEAARELYRRRHEAPQKRVITLPRKSVFSGVEDFAA